MFFFCSRIINFDLVFVSSRFVLNVPEEDQQSFERILFLVEYAYYEDNAVENDPTLKSLSLKEFTSLCILFSFALSLISKLADLVPWHVNYFFHFILLVFLNLDTHLNKTFKFIYLLYKNIITSISNQISTNKKVD